MGPLELTFHSYSIDVLFESNHDLFEKIIIFDHEFFPFSWPRSQWQILTKQNQFKLSFCLDSKLDVQGFALSEINEDEFLELSSYLHKIIVHPELRGKLVAQKLLEAHFIFLNDSSVKSNYLDVEEGNFAARSFYQKNGYSEVFKKNKFYSNGENALYCKASITQRASIS